MIEFLVAFVTAYYAARAARDARARRGRRAAIVLDLTTLPRTGQLPPGRN